MLIRNAVYCVERIDITNVTFSLFLVYFFVQLRVVEVLLEHGADVNHQDSQGKTPIHVCVNYNRYKSALLLADANCDLDFQCMTRLCGTWNGFVEPWIEVLRDPLDVAIIEERWKMARLLVQCGANVHSKFKYLEHQRIMERKQTQVPTNWALPLWFVEAIEMVQTLKMYCRKRIRKQLAGGRDVSQGVDTLPLPKLLKDYVLFKGRETSELLS